MIQTKKEINKKIRHKKYTLMYRDVQDGASWSSIAKIYGYKNSNSARTMYYHTVIPFLKENGLTE